jgi:hypothetical protein
MIRDCCDESRAGRRASDGAFSKAMTWGRPTAQSFFFADERMEGYQRSGRQKLAVQGSAAAFGMKWLTKRVWDRLPLVTSLSFVARSSASKKTGWTGEARGSVEVQRPSPDCIDFIESGSWNTPAGKRTDFFNTYRWTLLGTGIRLEHLRLGAASPVHLVDFVPVAGSRMNSETPHVCSADRYRASLDLGEDLKLSWSITGPRKREAIDCVYFTRNVEPTVFAQTTS